ncbi:hypothetical protein SAMN04489729_2661 [Amycolatopsis lurida]|uniref:Uncharacterized protein n=1 Tax=Amycolatopsis lurida NRRL 2430 TaxID=1460371 RepID=A0A2P2FI08_AMYLU|nr:hypothetical protein [Amycolatopsis lurida]KFU76363.1 hypothetical protein BB31_36565 [Amycolatopsis lurida NRRL 2430]SEC86616.1 hypothetical protein SAMN04489729_2661 [Amycolatopsis lurida]
MSDYPSHPASAETSTVTTQERPGTINGAFWAFLASAVIGLLSGVLAFASKDALVEATRNANRQSGTQLTEAQIDQAATFIIVIGLVIAVAFALLYLLFAAKLRAGRNWARIVLTVLTALQLISIIFSTNTIVGYLSVLAAVIGVVLSFTAPSNEYITATKVAR